MPKDMITGHQCDFIVRYRFLSTEEGGRKTLPYQGYRSDFRYSGDDISRIYMIHPAFVDETGMLVPKDIPVPQAGIARMRIISTDRSLREYHRNRINIGIKGYFVEGPSVVAECEVIRSYLDQELPLYGAYFRILAENEQMVLGHEFEAAFIIHKTNGKKSSLGYFYGDPVCALIDRDSNWFLIGGDKLILSRQDKISAIDLFDIHDLRQTDRNKAEILTDPWSRKPAVWELNTDTKEVRMVRLFNDYTDHEYTDNIIW